MNKEECMKKFIFVILLKIFVLSSTVYANVITDIRSFSFPQRTGKEVLILISDKISTFEEVKDGIYDSLRGYNIYTYNFQGDTNLMKEIPGIISKIKPNVVVAIGVGVLENLVGKVDVPVVFTMVINYKKFNVESYKNIAGVSLQVPVESVFFNLKTVYPNFKKVGVICSQEYYSSFISPYVDSVKLSLEVEIVPSIISSSKDYINAYNSLVRNVDVMWMVPDTSVLDKNSIVYFINESFKNSKPTVVYSEPFVEAGGFFSVSPNYSTIGSQVALMVRRIVEDKVSPNRLGIAPVVGTFTTVNREMAKKLNVDENILGLVDKVVK